VADTSPARGRWASRPVPPEPRSVVELIRAGTLDSELAATVWLLLEGRVPLVVTYDDDALDATALLGALLDFVPPDVRVVELAGAHETFGWLPQASELGWPGVGHAPSDGLPIRPESTVLLAAELSDRSPASTWGEAARIAVRAASIGYGLAATIHADSLDDVFARLRAAPVLLAVDELSRLGVVLVLCADGERGRVVAAHYVRPVVRDVHGHVQRLGPAVLSTWDAGASSFEHFGWGVTPELAIRVGMKAGDFEQELALRRDVLDGLMRHDVTDVAAVREALGRHRSTSLVHASASSVRPPAAAPH